MRRELARKSLNLALDSRANNPLGGPLRTKYPVYSQLAGNLGSETSSLKTCLLQRRVACEPEPLTLALFGFAYGVCYGATIALRPAVIADHFAGPEFGGEEIEEAA
jgi:hypothetical protein